MLPEDKTALAFQGKTEAGLADIEQLYGEGTILYGAPNEQLKL